MKERGRAPAFVIQHSLFIIHHSFYAATSKVSPVLNPSQWEGFYFYGMAYRREVPGATGWVATGSYGLVRPKGQGPAKEAAGRNGWCEKSWRG
jgi:hypothetical protein